MIPYKEIPSWIELLQRLEAVVEHHFNRPELVFESLTHSSYSNETFGSDYAQSNNERMEFLGDAVIGLVIASLLMQEFPDACEGRLSRWRSTLVSRKTLAEIAAKLGLGELLLLGRGEQRTGGAEKCSILAAVFEAVVGAVYLDSGLLTAEKFLTGIYRPWIQSLTKEGELILSPDHKTFLQEKAQCKYKTTPVYRLAEAWGPEHQKSFRVEILLDGRVVASGLGKSKKEAEQKAASAALEVLEF